MKKVPLLQSLDEVDLARLADELTSSFFVDSSYIIRQGDSGDTFYIISEGEALITTYFFVFVHDGILHFNYSTKKSGEDGPVLAKLGPGDYFGEMALLGDDTRQENLFDISVCANFELNFITG